MIYDFKYQIHFGYFKFQIHFTAVHYFIPTVGSALESAGSELESPNSSTNSNSVNILKFENMENGIIIC